MRAFVAKTKVFKREKVPHLTEVVREKIEKFLREFREKKYPIDFEFGSGAGVHSIQYARGHLVSALISVEKTREKFEKFASRLRNHDPLPNLLALHANAISVLAHAIEENSLRRIFLWYPNPFPEKARFVRTPFFEFMLSRVAPDGSVHFATNVEAYAHEMKVFFSARADFQLSVFEVFDKVSRPDFRPRTLFEKKYFHRGEKLYDLKVTKTGERTSPRSTYKF